MFLNLKHGEKYYSHNYIMFSVKLCYSYYRLAYGVFLIDSLLEKYVSQRAFIMYDVACTLHKHLKVGRLTGNCLITHITFFYKALWKR